MITEESLLSNKIFKKLDSLGLDSNDFIIMGSGIMFALGIRSLSELDDIDIYVTASGWNKVRHLSEIHHNDKWNCDHIYLFENKVEIFNGWGPGKYNIKELLKNAYKVGKYNFASANEVIRWKKELGRDKDYKHIGLINDFLRNKA